MLALLVIISTGVVLGVRYRGEDAAGEASQPGGAVTTPAHVLTDVSHAKFLSIFVYDGNGGVSSFMVGGSTGEFSAFVSAVYDARPIDHQADASFSDLLVFVFGPQDTLEVSYSRDLNLLMFGDQAYTPAANLAPMISDVEKRFN